MGADAWGIEHGYRFTRWMLGGNVVIVLLFVINAICQWCVSSAVLMTILFGLCAARAFVYGGTGLEAGGPAAESL